MSDNAKLSEITEKTPLIKDFVKRLSLTSKQSIPIVDVEKVKRIAGKSARPVLMTLEEGQSVKIYIRVIDDHFDIFRIDINGKMQPLSGDFDNSYKPSFNASVDQIANQIKTGQKNFTAKVAKKSKTAKTKTKRKAPKNLAQQRNEILEQASEADKVIAEKEAEKARLSERLEQIKAGNLPVPEDDSE